MVTLVTDTFYCFWSSEINKWDVCVDCILSSLSDFLQFLMKINLTVLECFTSYMINFACVIYTCSLWHTGLFFFVLALCFYSLEVLDAPELQDDFYLNLVDWSSQNVLSVGLGSCVYLGSACTSQVTRLCDLSGDGNSVTSVAWNERVSHRSESLFLFRTVKCISVKYIYIFLLIKYK
jgi:hypothetical protein